MKPILLTLAVLTATIIAAEIEPPRITGARFDNTNVVIRIRHPHTDLLLVRQVSDGNTNDNVIVKNESRNRMVLYTVACKGATNVFTAKAVENGIESEWSEPITIIPKAR